MHRAIQMHTCVQVYWVRTPRASAASREYANQLYDTQLQGEIFVICWNFHCSHTG